MARNLSNFYIKPALDARSDSGYGRSSLKFTKPRAQGSAYPYSMTDEQEEESEEIEDIEIDDVPIDFITKTRHYTPVTDFYAAAGTDPFYYAGGATKLSEELGKSGWCRCNTACRCRLFCRSWLSNKYSANRLTSWVVKRATVF